MNFTKGTITINNQLQKIVGRKEYQLIKPKNGKGRCITPPPFVMSTLRKVKHQQLENRIRYGECWEDSGFVFTNELGQHLTPKPVYDAYKKVVAGIGRPDARFHDLRHSYAVASIRAGDDLKTVQENLGHATAAFTMNVYAHVTDQMKKDSAARMEQYIQSVSG